MFDERVVRIRRKTDAEVVTRGAVETTTGQEVLAEARIGGSELLDEKLFRCGIRLEDSSTLTDIPLGASVLVGELKPDLRGEFFDRLGERQVIDLFEECEDVTLLATPETIEIRRIRSHVKTRRLLVVEGTQTLLRVNARAFQGDILADDVRDVDALSNLVNVRSSNSPRHSNSLRPGSPRHQVHSLSCHARADWSVREATWSITARMCSSVDRAARKSSANCRSIASGPRRTSASQRSVSTSRW